MRPSFLLIIGVFLCSFLQAQVNLQTGAAQFSLPLYKFSDPGSRLACDVSLNYADGNGLKVSEISSSIGTGWNLQAGGVIARIQHGEPDDQKQDLPYNYSYRASVYVNNYYPNGYLYSEFSPLDQIDNGGSYTPLFTFLIKSLPPKKYITDREQDVFSFNFNGRSGEFVIGKDGTIKTIGNSKLVITKVITNMSASNIRTRISEFDVLDETGIKYVFKDLELSEALKYDQVHQYNDAQVYDITALTTCQDWTSCKRMLLGRGLGEYIVSKWYLSEIVNPLTNQKITFDYEDFNIDMNGEVSLQKSYQSGSTSLSYSVVQQKIKGIAKRLKKINLSTAEQVVFNYSAALRLDLPTDKYLTSINVLYNNELKYGWAFTQQYMGQAGTLLPINYSPTVSDVNNPYYRLYLASIKKTGKNGTSDPPYVFTYNLQDPTASDFVPAPFSFQQDGWGYSNSDGNVWSIPYDAGANNLDGLLSSLYIYKSVFSNPNTRKPWNLMASIGILNKVQYPTGGTIGFEYQQNTAWDNANNVAVNVGGVRVGKTTVYDGADHARDVQTTYTYLKDNGNTSGWGYEPLVYTNSYGIRIWKDNNARVPGFNVQQVASLMPAFFNLIMRWVASTAAGVVTEAAFVQNFVWVSVISIFAAIAVQQIVDILFDLFSSNFHDYNVTDYSSTALNAGNLLPLQYSRVETKTTQGTVDNGKTIYEYTSPDDYALMVPTLAFPYSNKQRLASWVYGLPKHITIRDKNNVLKKEILNTYTNYVTTSSDQNFASQKWAPNFKDFNSNDGILTDGTTGSIVSDFYYPTFGRSELTQTREYTSNANGDFAVKTTNFQYSTSNYQLSQSTTTNSRNEQLRLVYTYPSDYTSSGFVQSLLTNNIVNVPIGSFYYITKQGTTEYLLNGSVTEFGTTANGDLKPVNTYTYRSDLPVSTSALQLSTTNWNPNTNTNYFKITENLAYDSKGQLVQANKEEGKLASLFDYDGRLPVAVAANAAAADLAYTSFEGPPGGNWNYDAANTWADLAPTGRQWYKFPSAGAIVSTTSPLDPSKTYILSFWCKAPMGGAPYVNRYMPSYPFFTASDVTLKKSYANGQYGWAYYEYEIHNATSVSVDNYRMPSGSEANLPRTQFQIDELRLYPKGSTIATSTYDPLIGKTSECDANGRITYYEYDNLGRLKLIKDENRNVVKAFEYNYKQ